MMSFRELLDESVAQHGHLCPGQILGVRMAMLGCGLLAIEDPRSRAERKKLIVFVEMDRCATDAIASVTGCSMGKRTLKFRDYGIMAATFFHSERDEAYRIVAREEAKLRARVLAPGQGDPFQQQLQAYRTMPDRDLFRIQRVEVELAPWELPGPPRRHARCTRCGQVIRDGREIHAGTSVLCRPCAGEAYFHPRINESARALP
jgi:formylmethanofuran dehydrogenase subunit E